MEFPLAQRELTQAGRDRRTYILRTVLAGGAVVFLLLAWMFRTFAIVSMGSSGLTGGAEAMGQALADTALAIQLIATFLVAPIASANLICSERQEGTLGLLLMADLSGRDVFLAKFLRAFLFTEVLLLSMLPFQSFAALLGGVSVPDVAARFVVLTFYTAALCSVGLLFSALSRRPAGAFFMTVLTVAAWLFLGMLVDARLLPALGIDSVAFSVHAVLEDLAGFEAVRRIIAPQAAVAILVGLAAAAIAIRLLPRLVAPSKAPARAPVAARRRFWRMLFLGDPAEHIVASGSSGFISGLRPWPLRIPIFLLLVGLSSIPTCGVGFIVNALMFFDILSSLHGARRDGALDELALTPLSDRALAKAIFKASLRPALFYGAAQATAAVVWGVLMAPMLFDDAALFAPPGSTLPLSAQGFLLLAILVFATVLTALSRLIGAASGAALASYIGIQRGSLAVHTAVSMVVSLLLGLAATFFYYLTLALLSIRSVDWPWMVFEAVEPLARTVGALLSIGVYAAATFIFFMLLADRVRQHLISQPQIYVAARRPAGGAAG